MSAERAAAELISALADVPAATRAKFRVLFTEMQRLKLAATLNVATVRALQRDRDHWKQRAIAAEVRHR